MRDNEFKLWNRLMITVIICLSLVVFYGLRDEPDPGYSDKEINSVKCAAMRATWVEPRWINPGYCKK